MARPSRNSIVMTVIILPSSANNVRFTYPGEAKHRANTIYNAQLLCALILWYYRSATHNIIQVCNTFPRCNRECTLIHSSSRTRRRRHRRLYFAYDYHGDGDCKTLISFYFNAFKNVIKFQYLRNKRFERMKKTLQNLLI